MNIKGWKEKLLGETLTLQRGFDLPNNKRKPGNISIVSSSGISGKHCEAKVVAPGVVTGRYGTIGQVFFIEEDFWPLNTTLFVKDFKGNDPLFISFLLRTIDFQSFSDKSGVPGVNRNDLHGVKIQLPPLPEQRAIAQSLSDVDVLIAALDQLITKKRNIKQGTLQQLLTGKKRLPGFSGEWSSIRVDCVAKITTGDKDTKDRVDEGKYPFFVRSQIVERINTYAFDGEAILTAGDGVGVGKVYHYINGKFDFHQRVYMIYDFDGYDGKFFFYYFSTHFLIEAKKYNAKNSVDSVRRGMIAGMEVPFPKLLEQKAIAQVLSDMEAEIEALEQKRDKYKALKQGMMQELLTGKTRLIDQP